MTLDELRNDIAKKQKKGLPFILASVIIWAMILAVCALNLPVQQQNLIVFCCSCPLLPLAWIAGKIVHVNIFEKSNELGKLGFLFTLNQLLYILIVMWVFNAVPDKMVMVYAMVFGSHLLPYSWLYKSISYRVLAVAIPIIALIVGSRYSALAVAISMLIIELIFVLLLYLEQRIKASKA